MNSEKVQPNNSNSNNHRNRVLINILSEVLEVVDFIVDVEKGKKGHAYFTVDTEEKKEYGINCVESLFEGLFQASLNSLKFCVSGCEDGGVEIVAQESVLKQKLRDIRHQKDEPYLISQGLSEQDTSGLESFVKELEGFFVVDEKKKELTDKLNEFIGIRNQWEGRKMPFLLTKDIERYLQCYYDLLLFLLLNENILDEHERLYGLKGSLLSTLLRLDVCEEEERVSFFSPLALNGIRKMYLLVDSYYKKIKDDRDDNAVIRFMEKNVIVEKVQHMFRWFFYGETGELAHAAVSPYDEEEEEKKRKDMEIPCKKIGDYNSYEAVYELRTAEKILYELKNWLNSRACRAADSNFNVVLVGDLNTVPLLRLCDYLENVIREKWKDKQEKIKNCIKIQLYSKTNLKIRKKSKWEFIKEVRRCGDGVDLFRENVLRKLMEESNVIFLLDCVKLYNPMSFSLELSPEYYKQRMANSSFSTWLLDNNIDYSNLNCLNELYNCMNIYMCHGRLGKYVKRANETLVSYCQNFYGETAGQERSTLYIYVSDLRAFSRLYNDDNYYMRTERYNQKEIGIIRFTNFKNEPELKDTHPQMITFNLWQMVKHICIKKLDKFIPLIKEKLLKGVKEEELKMIHVGIDYSDWRNELTLHYYDDRNPEEENTQLLEDVVISVLKDGNDLFQQYFQRAVYSFLYGNARTYDDMVFIYLFYNKRKLLGEIRVAVKNDPVRVKNNISAEFKYSIKRFVEEGISKLDFAGFNLYDKYFIAGRNRKTLNKIYDNLHASCEELGYTDSCLYRNSQTER